MCSFSEYVKNNKIEYEHVKAFVENIKNLCECLEEYLLSINHVIMDEKYIFFDERNRYIEFLYNPFEEGNFTEGMKRIISGILPSINHDDQATILLAYGLMEALDENCVTVESLENVVKSVEEELRGRDIYKVYQDDFIVDNIAQTVSYEEESENETGVKGRRVKIKEVIAERIEGLIKKEKRIQNKKKYKERPLYQLEDNGKMSGK